MYKCSCSRSTYDLTDECSIVTHREGFDDSQGNLDATTSEQRGIRVSDGRNSTRLSGPFKDSYVAAGMIADNATVTSKTISALT